MKTWMIETPPGTPGARADSQWQSVKADKVRVESGALRFDNFDGSDTLILAPGTWLSCHDEAATAK